MANDLIEFNVIKNGIRKIRDRAEIGIKRITADFLVSNFFEDIEVMKKRGYRFDEILDELNIMLAEAIPDKAERNKMFAIKSGTLKVYMSRKRKEIAEASAKAVSEKQVRNKSGKKTTSETSMPKEAEKVVKAEATLKSIPVGNVPTGRAKATDLDREI
ncbi:MAG: hypothetical protein PHO83_14410 [Geobacteraceae bacterium]|nr:hypothetical protein [Geobacteraceae bacterium]